MSVSLPGHHDRVRDQRIEDVVSLVTPAEMLDELPLSATQEDVVLRGRSEVSGLVNNGDDRLLVVVGPCSVHDPDAALDYARRLADDAVRHGDGPLAAMGVGLEKPRTTTG